MSGGIHAEKHVLLLHFLFKEKDGCFQEVGRKDRLADFLDVFAFESKLVGWESFERGVFESFWTLPFHACYSLQESPGIHVCYDGRRFNWMNGSFFFENSYPTQQKNVPERKKKPGKQNKFQPFWGQGINHHQRIQLDPTVSGSHHGSWHQCALTAFPRRMAATSRWCWRMMAIMTFIRANQVGYDAGFNMWCILSIYQTK